MEDKEVNPKNHICLLSTSILSEIYRLDKKELLNEFEAMYLKNF